MIICFLADAQSINTVNWTKYLSKNNEVHIISFNMNYIDGVKVHYINPFKQAGKIGYLFALGKIRKIIKDIHPDIINGYYISSYGLLGWLSGFKPLILTAAGSDIFGGFLKSKYRILRNCANKLIKNTSQRADLILSWTEIMAKRIETLGGDRNKIFTLPRGVDLSYFYPLQNREMCDTRIRIIHTRSLKSIYNIPAVLKVIHAIHELGHEVELILVGDGPQKGEIIKNTLDLNLQNSVKLLGKVTYTDMPHLLRTCDFYISLSSSDGASSSLFEAMACGLLPIVSNIKANSTWIKDGCNGFLVETEDEHQIATRIISAFSDRSFFKTAVSHNLKLVRERLSWETNMQLIENKIMTCLLDYKHSNLYLH